MKTDFLRIMKRHLHRLLQHWRWYRHRHLYVIADARDNSVTLSEQLVELINPLALEEVKVMAFRVAGNYAFIVNPEVSEPTHLAELQYNQKHRCVGFECLVPTVNRIFFDYGIQAEAVKLSVEPVVCSDTLSKTHRYYKILRP